MVATIRSAMMATTATLTAIVVLGEVTGVSVDSGDFKTVQVDF